jgi:hypothetical protein
MHASAINQSLLDPSALAALDERVKRFSATKDPEELWPGLREHERVAAACEIERLTVAFLGGEPLLILDASARHRTYAIAVAAHTTGMGPLLGYWLEQGRLSTPAPHAERLADHLQHARRRSDRMMTGVLPAVDALIAAGVRPLAMKGLHTGTTMYAARELRRMSDIDLLIRPEETERATTALRGVGFAPWGVTAPHKSDWIGPGVSSRTHSLEVADEFTRWTIELHTSLDSVFYSGVVARLDALASDTTDLDIEGRSFEALEPEALLILLACHCSELEANRLLRVFELVLAVRCGVNWDHVLELLDRTQAARFTWPAFYLAESLAPHTVDSRVLKLAEKESTWAARHTVKRLTAAGGRIGDMGLIRQLMWAQGPTAALQRVGRLLWPAPIGAPTMAAGGWGLRFSQWRRGRLTLSAPDERARP